jgi:hypothetical protein
MSDYQEGIAAGMGLGILVPFVALFGAAGIVYLCRWLKAAIIYAKPAHFERRLKLAGRVFGARRAYHLSSGRVSLFLLLGDEYRRSQQAAAVLHDAFAPRERAPKEEVRLPEDDGLT